MDVPLHPHADDAPSTTSLLSHHHTSTTSATYKRLQNTTYRACGIAGLFLGCVGFAPSIAKALITGSLWSVSHDAPHTENAFLDPHAVGAVIWTVACVAQLCTGGVPKYPYVVAHRIGGYVGAVALLVAMVLAAANELTYATPQSALGSAYTLLLVLGATCNMLLAVVRARQRRFPEHKDSMLLAIMFTMDPAVHRLAMWAIRLPFLIGDIRATLATTTTTPNRTHPVVARIDPTQLLILGKMPANLILYVLFGCMFIRSRRVNCLTALCTSFNLVAFIGGTAVACAGGVGGSVSPVVWGLAIAGTAAMLLTTAAFVVIERRKRSRERE
jgi:hypothetical protein